MSSANKTQIGGTHYKVSHEHWDYTALALEGRYFEGNISKYVIRHRKKGDALNDLYKALHYIDKLMELTVEGVIKPLDHSFKYDIQEFIVANGLNSYEAFVVRRLAHWEGINQLNDVRGTIYLLVEHERERLQRMEAIKAGGLDWRSAMDAEAEDAGPGYSNQDR